MFHQLFELNYFFKSMKIKKLEKKSKLILTQFLGLRYFITSLPRDVAVIIRS